MNLSLRWLPKPYPKWLWTMRTLRICLACIGVLSILFGTALFIHQLVLPVLAIFVPQLESAFYDIAVYGSAPTRHYHSSDLQPPDISVVQWDSKCDDGGQIFIGPYGKWVETPGPTIMDTQGNLIWKTEEFGMITNLQLQEYKGEQLMTFWVGEKEGAKGKGFMYMLNSRYEVVRKLEAVGEGLWGDLHEFQLTTDGTALITVYNDTTIDMRDFGFFRGEHGWITDCGFQEIDVETNELLFEWFASEHVRAADTHYFQPTAGFSASEPFDFYHINSIDKDSKGNYLISSRHFHAITYIDGRTGDIIWTLGMDHNDFVDISETPNAATDFCWSHHARWFDEEKGLITLFNNGNAGPLHRDRSTSKGMMIQVDQQAWTVKLVQEYYALYNTPSYSQGNVQYLSEQDQLLMGWGGSSLWTQHEMDGTLLCEVHYGPSLLYLWESVKSYRIFKYWGWKGDPQWPPQAKVYQGKVYASWNGATEVASWRVEGLRVDEEDVDHFQTIGAADKDGFETAMEVPQEGFSHFRVVALDAQGEVLRRSDPAEQEEPESAVPMIVGACVGVLFIAGFACLLRALLIRTTSSHFVFPWRRRTEWSEYKYSQL